MKTSAGAPDSICLARALLAPYETMVLLPVAASKVRACSSITSLRLAAAKTATSAAKTDAAEPRMQQPKNNDATRARGGLMESPGGQGGRAGRVIYRQI